MVECLVHVGEPQAAKEPLRLTFAVVPHKGEQVVFKRGQGNEVDAYNVRQVAYMAAGEGAPDPEIHRIVWPAV